MHRCGQCEKSFSRNDSLQRHLKYVHKNNEQKGMHDDTPYKRTTEAEIPSSNMSSLKGHYIVPYDDYLKFLDSQRKSVGFYKPRETESGFRPERGDEVDKIFEESEVEDNNDSNDEQNTSDDDDDDDEIVADREEKEKKEISNEAHGLLGKLPLPSNLRKENMTKVELYQAWKNYMFGKV